MMSRKHILFGCLLLLITLVYQIAAEEEAPISENPTNVPDGTASDHSDKTVEATDYDYNLAKEEEMFEKYFDLFNT